MISCGKISKHPISTVCTSTHIDVLNNMHMKPALCGLELEVGDGRIKLDIDKALPDSVVYLRDLVTLKLDMSELQLQ
jgi:hypothetical protein